jgi:hypothetical protein
VASRLTEKKSAPLRLLADPVDTLDPVDEINRLHRELTEAPKNFTGQVHPHR